jgi:hypothetical protein
VIAREELAEALAASAARSTAVTTTEAEEEVAPSLAPVPGSVVPPWREGLPVTVLAPDFSGFWVCWNGSGPRVTDRFGPRRSRWSWALGQRRRRSGGAVEARRLAERGWLLLEASGAFSVGRRPVAVPDAGSSA